MFVLVLVFVFVVVVVVVVVISNSEFIPDRFVNQILYLLPTVYGDFKTQCLEILLARVEQIPNLFTELKSKGLKELLAHRYTVVIMLISSFLMK